MLVRLRDLRALTGIVGKCTHTQLPSPSSRSRRSVQASKDKKKFNAQKKRAPAKASPAAVSLLIYAYYQHDISQTLSMQGDLEAEKKVAIVPPRIDSNSNIPVRRQQRFVRAKEVTSNILKSVTSILALLAAPSSCLQEAEAAAKRVPYKQTFRKAKIDPEQRAEVIM